MESLYRRARPVFLESVFIGQQKIQGVEGPPWGVVPIQTAVLGEVATIQPQGVVRPIQLKLGEDEDGLAETPVLHHVVKKALPADFHRRVDIHVHLPAGATPKDGPSAGIALAVALASALTGTPVRGHLAMTGEVTLRGRVLPVGGIREKGVAAHRHGITQVLLPHGNARDLTELPDPIRTDLNWQLVRSMDEVLAHALTRPLPFAPARLPKVRRARQTSAGVRIPMVTSRPS